MVIGISVTLKNSFLISCGLARYAVALYGKHIEKELIRNILKNTEKIMNLVKNSSPK